jgi:hypothetical protein
MVITCHDHGDSVADRFSVVFWSEFDEESGLYPVTFFSADCDKPNGVCQHDAIPEKWIANLGVQIEFEEMPKACQKVANREMDELMGRL